MTGEFDIIQDILAPLSQGADGAFDLVDDAALITGGEYVVTKDLLVEGVHFLKSDPLDLVARKLVRANLSDLAAKGAKPVGYFLGCVWPANVKRKDIELFAEGLSADQEEFRIRLFGGDTTRHKVKTSPLTLSATFFGAPPRAGFVPRTGAKAGDNLYVSGVIGDAGLGLAAQLKKQKFCSDAKDYLIGRYRLPEPRLKLGGALPGLASAALDVSDGLIADAGHLIETARLGVEISANAVPLSPETAAWVEAEGDYDEAIASICTFGDDYELLFTAPAASRRAVEMAAKVSKTKVTRIGLITKGEGVRLINSDGHKITVKTKGYDHFAEI